MKKDWMVKESDLDDRQYEILMSTLEKSCVVRGCAGSGKSVLALIKARRIQEEQTKNYQVIVFTNALKDYMNATEIGLENKVQLHYQWKQKPYSAEYTIVDEIQDFSQKEIEEMVAATEKRFFFFGDTAQALYSPNMTYCNQPKKPCPVEKVSSIPSLVERHTPIKEYELFYNYRLPVSVAKVAQYVGVNLEPFEKSKYKSKETEMPRFLRCGADDQLSIIHNIIAKRSLSDVAILLPDNGLVKKAYEQLKKMGNYEYKCRENRHLNFKTSNPKIMTYASAKGLQFETVFLPWIEKFSNGASEESLRTSLYVAMTRTYRDLYVLYKDTMPKPFATIPSDLFKTTETDTTEDF